MMPDYNIEILPLARDDLAEIYHYIALDNPEAALKTTDNIMEKIESLAIFPERCALVQDGFLAKQGYRKLSVGNYLVFFKIFQNTVIVYRVLHGKRNYPKLLE
jgi:plasmid stabilization system protein ParE